MSNFGILFVLILIVLAALMADHYTRLKKVGWMPDGRPQRSAMDPIGSALGELGRADGPYRLIAGALDVIGKGLELVFAPIGAVLSMISGAKR